MNDHRDTRKQVNEAPKLAYIVSRFPKLTETFVLNEILALEAEGVSIELFPLLRERQAVQHPEARRWSDRAHFHRFVSSSIVAAQLYHIRRNPKRYFGLWAEVLRGTWGSRNFFLGAIGILPKCVRFAYDMQRLGITHVHAHFANHPALAAFIIHRLTGIPYSFTAHGSDLHVERRMLNVKVANSAFTVTISNYNRELIHQECGASAEGKVVVVHCGIDPSTFSARTERLTHNVLRIVCVGSLEEVKGHAYLIEACRMLRDHGVEFRCELVGDGPLRKELLHRIKVAGLQNDVVLHGGLPRQRVAELLQSADIAVLASVMTERGKREGIPVALMEAMACELPVVSTRISGIPELVEDGVTGFLVPPRDGQSLFEALLKLAADPKARRKLGRAGRQKVLAEFNLYANTQQLLEHFAGARYRRELTLH
jgi:colanic acid/amylovoran biosynthesis glycosyltransferase